MASNVGAGNNGIAIGFHSIIHWKSLIIEVRTKIDCSGSFEKTPRDVPCVENSR